MAGIQLTGASTFPCAIETPYPYSSKVAARLNRCLVDKSGGVTASQYSTTVMETTAYKIAALVVITGINLIFGMQSRRLGRDTKY